MDKYREIKTSYGTVRNNNVRSRSKLKIAAIAATVIVVASSVPILNALINNKKKPEVSSVPDNQIIYTVDVDVNKGDTLSELALQYYNDDCDNVYNSFDNYIDDIARGNGIEDKNLIDKNTTYKLPVVIDKDNEYYVEFLKAREDLNNILQNEKWVTYTIKAGDSISKLAMIVSMDNNELIENTNSIISHNQIDPNRLKDGDIIEILNPKIGEAKSRLLGAKKALDESLKVNQVQK